jgi:uncharacterized RDD family membrane protein YckC
MKCPKCHYLSFDPEPRCRNCGYTLSLDNPDLDIALPARDDGPLADFSLRDPDSDARQTADWEWPPVPPETPAASRRTATPLPETPRRSRTSAPGPFDAFAIADVPDTTDETASAPPGGWESEFAAEVAPTPAPAPPAAERPVRHAAPITTELPLFMRGTRSDPDPDPAPERATPVAPVPAAPVRPAHAPVPVAPVRPAHAPVPVSPVPAAPVRPAQTPRPAQADPRPPVAVRRTTPESPVRHKTPEPRKIGPLDRDLLDDLQRIERADERLAAASRRQTGHDSAGPIKRLTAALVDAALLAALSAAVVWTTLRWCDLSWSQLSLLPATPVAGLLLMMVLGYLFMFTAAGGQTLGKMLAGIRVVDAGVAGDTGEPLSMRQAMYREMLTIPSVLLIGAGFVSALFGDERAVHDRIAATRVVRA